MINNEMDCYLNKDNLVFMSIGQKDEDVMNSGYITLTKDDVRELIQLLSTLERTMEE